MDEMETKNGKSEVDFTPHPIIENLFQTWRADLGKAYEPYRNHVYRVFSFACRLSLAKGEDIEKLAIAAAFHDVGIWLDGSFDYLNPSIKRARDYLETMGRKEWQDEISFIIDKHHKVTAWRGAYPTLVEAFRRADWIDVCLFALPTKIPRSFLRQSLTQFPRKGFHWMLTELFVRWAVRHPLRPLPMFKR